MARITRQQARIDLTEVQGVNEMLAEARDIMRGIADWKERLRIAEEAAPVVIESARRLANAAFQNKKVHFRYDTKHKISGRLRAARGRGIIKAEYTPGNLSRSIIDIASRRAALRRGYRWKVIIGPYYQGRLGARGVYNFNSEKKIDGYYAHMVYGSARAFQQRIMIPALLAVRAQVLAIFRREAQNTIRKDAGKSKFIDFLKDF